MRMSEQIKEMTVAASPEGEIASLAHQEGMQTLREDGLTKIRAGLTSFEEILRVTA